MPDECQYYNTTRCRPTLRPERPLRSDASDDTRCRLRAAPPPPPRSTTSKGQKTELSTRRRPRENGGRSDGREKDKHRHRLIDHVLPWQPPRERAAEGHDGETRAEAWSCAATLKPSAHAVPFGAPRPTNVPPDSGKTRRKPGSPLASNPPTNDGPPWQPPRLVILWPTLVEGDVRRLGILGSTPNMFPRAMFEHGSSICPSSGARPACRGAMLRACFEFSFATPAARGGNMFNTCSTCFRGSGLTRVGGPPGDTMPAPVPVSPRARPLDAGVCPAPVTHDLHRRPLEPSCGSRLQPARLREVHERRAPCGERDEDPSVADLSVEEI